MQALREANKNIREFLIVAMSDEANTMKQIDQIEQMLIRAEDRGIPRAIIDGYENRKMVLFAQLDKIATRKKRLNEECDRLFGFSEKKAKTSKDATPPTRLEIEINGDEVPSTITASRNSAPQEEKEDEESTHSSQDDDQDTYANLENPRAPTPLEDEEDNE